jgi:hypothetical protein
VPSQERPYGVTSTVDQGSAESFPASDAPAVGSGDDHAESVPQEVDAAAAAGDRPRRPRRSRWRTAPRPRSTTAPWSSRRSPRARTPPTRR